MKRGIETEVTLKKKAKVEEETSHFEYILKNPGLQHIVENILASLDVKTLTKCREVSQDFKEVINSTKSFHIQKIEWIMKNFKDKYLKEIDQIDQTERWLMQVTDFDALQKLMKTFDDTKPLCNLQTVADLLSLYIVRKDFGNSPLFFAVKIGNVDFLKLVINSPYINLFERDLEHNRSIHQACILGHEDIISLIIKEFENCTFQDKNSFKEDEDSSGDDSDSSEDDDYSPESDEDSFEEDEDSSEDDDEDFSNDDEDSPEDVPDFRDDLVNKTAEIFCSARKSGIQQLLKEQNKAGNTPVHEAFDHGHIDIVKMLIQIPGNWITKATNDKDELIHHKVCSAGNIELAKLLGSSSGFVEVDDNGKGPLQIAFEKGHIDIVKNIILNFKGHIDNRFARKKCLTIFDQVCFTEDEELIKLMMDE